MLFSPVSKGTDIHIRHIGMSVIPFSQRLHKILHLFDKDGIRPVGDHLIKVNPLPCPVVIQWNNFPLSPRLEYPLRGYIHFIRRRIGVHHPKRELLAQGLIGGDIIVNDIPPVLSFFRFNLAPIKAGITDGDFVQKRGIKGAVGIAAQHQSLSGIEQYLVGINAIKSYKFRLDDLGRGGHLLRAGFRRFLQLQRQYYKQQSAYQTYRKNPKPAIFLLFQIQFLLPCISVLLYCAGEGNVKKIQ